VRFSDVWLRYGRRAPWVLTAVDLELGPGDVAVVLGGNGAGKTTLLSAAAGLLRPARGQVLDRPASIGWVPERFPASQPYSVRTYLRSMARIRGVRDSQAAIDEWAQRLQLTRYLDARLAEISKGTAQKVGLAQALLVRPDLLVLDEPWEGLDASTREQVPVIINDVRAAGGSVLVSDHLGEVARVPDASQWSIVDGRVTVGAAAREARFVVEIEVPASAVASTVDRLRAQGHQLIRVREAADEVVP
jgi:ABC-type multidrug transport system ATPase subunit